MDPMEPGIEINQELLIEVLQMKVQEAVIREAQLETAIQQLIRDQNAMSIEIADFREAGTAPTQLPDYLDVESEGDGPWPIPDAEVVEL